MIEIERFTLKNGLKVLVHTDSSSPLATMNILYNAGARDEDPAKTGFAHLFEHLMFGGSVNIPVYDEPLQKVGGENNAFTNNDFTNYYLTLPAENLETGFWLESDRMLALDFSEKSLAIQKNVVIEEFKQRYLNQPYGDAWLLIRPMAYKKHPYRWATIGKEIKHIEEARLSDVKDFFYAHYAPNNAILTVTGNVNVRKVEDLALKWFGPIGKRDIKPRGIPTEPPQTKSREQTVWKDVPSGAIYKVFHMCSRVDPDYHTTDFISDILGNGLSSRLYQQLVKKQQLFSDISSYILGSIEPGLFVISGKLHQGIKPEKGDRAIHRELEKIMNDTVEQKELSKLKTKAESAFLFSQVSILNKAMNLSFFELIGKAEDMNLEIERYRSVSPEQIKNVAKKLFEHKNTSTLFYLPKNHK